MKLNCKFFFIALFFLFFNSNIVLADASLHGLAGFEESKINAAKNARLHNNLGNIFFGEKNYIAALKEYQIAYYLTANTNGCATYLYNMARCFMVLGNYELAKNTILAAIDKNCINITYYQTLVDCFIELDIAGEQFVKYINDYSIPYNRIVAGLILLKTGFRENAKILFDEFIDEYPDMLITDDVRIILNKLKININL